MKTFALICAILLFSISAVWAQYPPKVDQALKEIDPWVVSDTAKIMHYIDSTKQVTLDMLHSSKYWDGVEQDLSFLLGVDLITSPQIDNTGRIYFRMRLTGEQDALFYECLKFHSDETVSNFMIAPDDNVKRSFISINPWDSRSRSLPTTGPRRGIRFPVMRYIPPAIMSWCR